MEKPCEIDDRKGLGDSSREVEVEGEDVARISFTSDSAERSGSVRIGG